MIFTPLERSGQAPWEKLIENLLSPLSPLVRVEIWWSSMDEIMLHGDSSPDPTWWSLGIILTPSKRSDHPPWEMLIKISLSVYLLSLGWIRQRLVDKVMPRIQRLNPISWSMAFSISFSHGAQTDLSNDGKKFIRDQAICSVELSPRGTTLSKNLRYTSTVALTRGERW